MAKSFTIAFVLVVVFAAACTSTQDHTPAAAPVISTVAQADCHPELPKLDVLRTGGTPPKVLVRVEPRFPDEVVAEHETVREVVVLEVVIDKNGNIGDVCPLAGNRRFLRAAVDAVRQWKFAPATIDGQPVTVKFGLTVMFRMR